VFETSGKLTVALSAMPAVADVEHFWRGLERRADASFFQRIGESIRPRSLKGLVARRNACLNLS